MRRDPIIGAPASGPPRPRVDPHHPRTMGVPSTAGLASRRSGDTGAPATFRASSSPFAAMPVLRIPSRAAASILAAAILLGAPLPGAAQRDSSLAGVWEAKQRFGPDVRGTLLVEHAGGRWRAEVAGYVAEPVVTGSTVTF